MNPKEKAKELIKKFYPITYSAVHFINTDAEYIDSKKCAIILIDTILEDLDDYHDSHYHDERISYWNNVKQEIKKLTY